MGEYQVMNDQFVLLLTKSYLNSGKPCNSGQFTTKLSTYRSYLNRSRLCIILDSDFPRLLMQVDLY